MPLLSIFSVLLTGCEKIAMTINKANPVQIVIADQASGVERYAANELKNYIRKICGADCRIVSEKKKSSVPAVYVGETQFARNNKINFSALDKEEWIIKTVDNNLILCGGKMRGTLYAVYEFLENHGVVWADEVTEFVPKTADILIPAGKIQGKPSVPIRHITLGYSPTSTEFTQWNVRMRNTSLANPAAMGGGEHIGGCHTFHDFTDKSWKDEYFALTPKGVRSRSIHGGGPGQLCLTHPEVRKEVIKKLRAKIQADRKKYSKENQPFIYDISQNDNSDYCVCKNCEKALLKYKERSGVLLEFINAVADDIIKDYPDILIQTFAYTWTLEAPQNIKPSPNVMIRICKLNYPPHYRCDTVRANLHPVNKDYHHTYTKWHDISNHISIWEYWVLYEHAYNFPYISARDIAADIKYYIERKAKSFLVECEMPHDTSFARFKVWLGYQMLKNHNADFNFLADKFFNAYYGKAAPAMRKLMDYIQKRIDETPMQITGLGIMTVPYLDREFFSVCNNLLDEAETLAKDDIQSLKHVKNERIPVDIALIILRSRFGNDIPCGKAKTLQNVFNRYEKNAIESCSYYMNGNIYPRKTSNYNNIINRLKALRSMVFSNDPKLPMSLKDKEVIDLNWSFGSYSLIRKDSDAAFGHALELPPRTQPNWFKMPFEMGIYDLNKREHIAKVEIPAAKLYKDGKYHLYSLGKFKLGQGWQIFIHWSWLITMKTDFAYSDNDNREWEIFVSMKLDGKPFVKNSEKAGRVLVDRVLLVRPKQI